ncbi:MAG: hypothetical protein IKJ35_02750 [Clostridia bacterium]|nr:hypothetical protein [Clostridia bacterium]
MFGILALFSTSGTSFWEKIAAWYEKSLLNELLTYFREQYFTVEFGVYENFSVNPGMGQTVRNIIVAIALGLIVAFLMTAYFRIGLGNFVRKLLKEECFSPESAKNLMELGYFQSTMIRRELTKGGSLRMVVHQCEETATVETDEAEAVETEVEKSDVEAAPENACAEEISEEEQPAEVFAEASAEAPEDQKREGQAKKIDFLTARFYIPEDLRARAEIRFQKKGSGWGSIVLAVLLTIVGSALLCWLLPDIVRLADNLISFFAP